MIPRLHTILQRLLPNYCLICKEPTQSKLTLCQYCVSALPWRDNACCQLCAKPLPHPQICGTCLRRQPAFTQIITPFNYEPPLDLFINRLKFSQQLLYAYLLGQLLSLFLQKNAIPLPDVIIPIPLHPTRLRQRGFNQAGEIAKVVAKRLKCPCDHYSLKRIKATAPSAQLKARDRIRNVHNAFAVTKKIPFKNIALIDDVITTTATVQQACLALKKAGVNQVQVWGCARAT